VDSAEVLKALEAELRALDAKRAELARAIETIRGIIVVGKPETRSKSTQADEKATLAGRAVAYIRKSGGRAKMTDIVAAIGDKGKDERSQYGSIYGALKRRAEDDSNLTLAEPGVWQVLLAEDDRSA